MRPFLLFFASVAAAISVFMYVSCDDSHQTRQPGSNVNQGNQGSGGSDSAFSEESSFQIKYLVSLVASNGAIMKDGSGIVNPYFSNFAALALCTNPTDENIRIVKNHIEWYLDHLNGSMKQNGQKEVPGSIYDYSSAGSLSSGDYDSVDSYAATLLTLVEKLLEASPKDKSWILKRAADINSVAGAMLACMDTDGAKVAGKISPENNNYLTVAKLDYDTKLLMDNCEVNRGLKSAIVLQKEGILSDEIDYAKLLSKNTAGIESLWEPARGMYKWYDSANGSSSWQKFYPDATAQLWPVMFDVIDPSSKKAKDIYKSFQSNYPMWSYGQTYEVYPWAVICYAAACMNDTASVERYMEHLWSLNAAGRQKDYWYCAEAAWVILAIEKYVKDSRKK